jgi:hypothetical protein
MGRRLPERDLRRHLLDRLCHRVEIVQIAGESWRLKESTERSARRAYSPATQPHLTRAADRARHDAGATRRRFSSALRIGATHRR